MDDTSLADFLGDESGADDTDSEAVSDGTTASAVDETTEADAAETEADADTDVESATTTSQWASDGVDCADCGETVERVWESSAGLVCATCKVW